MSKSTAQRITRQDHTEMAAILAMDDVPGDDIVNDPLIPSGEEVPDPAPAELEDAELDEEAEQAEDGKIATGEADPMITIPGQDPAPLSTIVAAFQGMEATKQQIENDRNTLMVERSKAETYLHAMRELPDNVRHQIDQEHANRLLSEAALMHQAIPEMTTESGRLAVADELYGIAAKYGYTKQDINQIVDHKTIKMLLDFARQSKKIENAMNNVKPLRAKEAAPMVGTPAAPNKLADLTARANSSKRHTDEMAALAEL